MINKQTNSDQNNSDKFPSTESLVEELESKDKDVAAVKLKKQLLRGSSEKIMITNKFKKNTGEMIFYNLIFIMSQNLTFLKIQAKTN